MTKSPANNNKPFLGGLDLQTIGDRLRLIDRFVLEILKVRIADGGLSDWVAESKNRLSEDGVYSKRRMDVEDARISLMKKWAEELGINKNFAASIMYKIISESCLVQDEYMVKAIKEKLDKVDENDAKQVFGFLRENLLALTAIVAENYDDTYAEKFFATNTHTKFARKKLQDLIASLPERNTAVDLGCATGLISFEIAGQFKNVIGYDVSPYMINVARSKLDKKYNNVQFKEHDLEQGFDLPENSVSLFIMNMGTASEILNIEKVLSSIKKALRPEGKFFLSFYNSESLIRSIGFLPWSTPLAAKIDPERNCLEVSTKNGIFFVYAKSRTVKEVRGMLEKDFIVDQVLTYPSVASILPQALLETEDKDGNINPNPKARVMVKKIDRHLADSEINSGTYIIVTGSKK